MKKILLPLILCLTVITHAPASVIIHSVCRANSQQPVRQSPQLRKNYPVGELRQYFIDHFEYPEEAAVAGYVGPVEFTIRYPSVLFDFRQIPHHSFKDELHRIFYESPFSDMEIYDIPPVIHIKLETEELFDEQTISESKVVREFIEPAPESIPAFDQRLNYLEYILRTEVKPSGKMKNAVAQLDISFTVTAGGKITDLEIDGTDDQEIIKGVRQCFKSRLNKWTPCRVNGNAVDYNHRFRANIETDNNGNVIHTAPYLTKNMMVMFQYGDLTTFRHTILPNVRYPEEDLKNGVSGRVKVEFYIDTDGTLRLIGSEGPSRSLAKEGQRVVGLSPTWLPAYKNGEPQKVKLTLPIDFRINN